MADLAEVDEAAAPVSGQFRDALEATERIVAARRDDAAGTAAARAEPAASRRRAARSIVG